MTRPLRYDDLPNELNLASYFVDSNAGDRVALIDGDRRVTYRQLAERVNRAGNALRSAGVRRGDRVLIALTDGTDFVAVWYGAQKIGAVTAEVYPFLPEADHRYFIGYVRPAAVVTDSVALAHLRAVGARNLIVAGGAADLRPGERHLETLLAAQDPQLAAAPTRRDDVAMWKFTTGSTGAPKACILPVRSPVLSADWYARGVLELRPDDIVLPVPKMFFGYARDLTTLFPFGVGATGILFPQRSTPDMIFEMIRRHRPTILVNVPTMMSAMLAHPEAAAQDLSSIRLCTSAGEALPVELHRKWMDTFGIEVIDCIGSCEAYHVYLSNRPGAVRMGTLGKVVPGYRAQVVDPQGTPVPDGEVGVLEVTAEAVALGYWQAPEKSARTFVRPHTVRSGDLFTRDADGYFVYHGRSDDLLKVHGRWVVPIEVENCLTGHPAVVECAVGDYQVDGLTRLVAYAVVDGDVTADDLYTFLRARLSSYKCPRDIRLVPALARTASGKLDRQAVRAGIVPPAPQTSSTDAR